MDSLQKFYTKPEIARECCSRVQRHIKIDRNNDTIIEPSAGSGAFIPYINKLCNNTIFMDIKPEHLDVQKQNYLTYIPSQYSNIHIIGNPPFGFKASTAIKFIKKSVQFCNSMSFILPLSFAKQSMQHSVPLQFHLIHSWILPENSFMHYGKEMHIPCVFQIWMRKNRLRKQQQSIQPIGYRFVKDPLQADAAIRRVGSKAGSVYTETLHKRNTNSHYFIKLREKKDISLIHDINIPNKHYVTGPCSISKKDMIRQLNRIFCYS